MLKTLSKIKSTKVGLLSDFKQLPRFREELCDEIEKLYHENKSAALDSLNHFRARSLQLDENSLVVLLKYLRRFLAIFGSFLLCIYTSAQNERTTRP